MDATTPATIGRIQRPHWVSPSVAEWSWAAEAWVDSDQRRSGASEPLQAVLRAARRVLEAKDPYTLEHSRRVSRQAAALARRLGFPPATRREIAIAGQLHDIGKVAVPDALLQRAGPLTEAEHRRVLQHTVLGEAILEPVLPRRGLILSVVRSHHERVDGRGFPDGLKGEEIPLAARVVAVADAYDAMTSSRPYRGALSHEEAVAELRREAGRQFDAACVAAFASIRLETVLPFVPPRRARVHFQNPYRRVRIEQRRRRHPEPRIP